MIVTIDGVAASGKSSVSSGVARALGVPYLSSGLLYRAVAFLALEAGVDLQDARVILALLDGQDVQLEPLAEGNRVWNAGRDITEFLHSTRVDQGVSRVAALPEVRAWVDAKLRAVPAPFVAEGRDMGTNVFPQAQAKFYLTASARVRAERRAKERPDELEAIEADLIRRDAADRVQIAPAPDALVIDTGPLDLQGVIDTILSHLSTLNLSVPPERTT